MSAPHRLDYSVQDGVAVLAMNRPPVNALDHPMMDALHAALRRADASQLTRRMK